MLVEIKSEKVEVKNMNFVYNEKHKCYFSEDNSYTVIDGNLYVATDYVEQLLETIVSSLQNVKTAISKNSRTYVSKSGLKDKKYDKTFVNVKLLQKSNGIF